MIGPLVLDNEAVQALQDSRHRKHKHAIALVEAVRARDRGQRRRAPLVPTAVRVEAGWDRRSPDAAAINRLRVVDVPLDVAAAGRAAVLVTALGCRSPMRTWVRPWPQSDLRAPC